MEEFKVHRVRFFEYMPSPIHCMSYDFENEKLAVSRANNIIEIWNIKSRWFLEKTILPIDVESIEALCWCKGRLFSAGLHGFLKEYDLAKLCVKRMVPSNNGAIWCMTKNEKQNIIAVCIAAVGTEQGAVVLFNLTEDSFDYERAFEKQDARIFTLAWYNVEDLIVTGSVDNIRVWSVSSGRAIQRMSLARCATNQETIIWSITICRNFTVVSGDSRGITSFWNGHRGTLIKAFAYHKADVLSLVSCPFGNTVYAAGIDPCIVKFEYLPITKPKIQDKERLELDNNDDEDNELDKPWSQWIRTMVHNQHTHDIRSLVTTRNKLFSGGVDCQLVCNDLVTENRIKSKRKFASVPNENLIKMAHSKNLILLQYPDRLDLWKLGRSDEMSENDGEILKISKRPSHLMTLKSSQNRHIICSTISDNGEWLCYADCKGLRIFQLIWENYDKLLPKVSLKRVRITCKYENVLKIQFNDEYLCCLTNQGRVQLLDLKLDGDCLPSVELLEMPEALQDTYQHLICVSQTHIAVASLEGHCTVYDIKSKKSMCSLPQRDSPISCMLFTPSSKQINVFYIDRKILEYCLVTKKYTDWSRSLPMDFHPQWKQRQGIVSKAFYHPEFSNRLYLQDEYSLCYIDKTLPISDKHSPLFANTKKKNVSELDTKKYAFHVCDRYKYLLHIDICKDGSLVVIECPPMKIMDSLPPVLAMKKFGT